MMGVTPRVLTSPVSTCGRRRRVPPGSRSRWVAHPHAEIGGGTDICTACDDLTPIEREQPTTVNTPRPARGRRLNDLSLELGGPSPFSGVLDPTGQLTPGTAVGGSENVRSRARRPAGMGRPQTPLVVGDVPGRRRLGGLFVRTPGEVLDTADLLRHRPWPSAGPGCPPGRPRWPLTPSFRPEVRRLYLADEPRLWWTHAFARRFMMARPRYALSD